VREDWAGGSGVTTPLPSAEKKGSLAPQGIKVYGELCMLSAFSNLHKLLEIWSFGFVRTNEFG
jgi:hypothetical protein